MAEGAEQRTTTAAGREVRKWQREAQQMKMKKEMEEVDSDGKIGRREVEFEEREAGQSESSAPTMLQDGGGRRGKKNVRMKKKDGVSVVGVHDGQCSGAPPFVVPPMQFSIGM